MKTKSLSPRALIFLLCFLTGRAFAGIDAGAGTGAMDFLNVGIGAREAAMGGALLPGYGDANSIFSNPAALSRIVRPEMSFTYNRWLGGIKQQVVSYARPAAGGVIGGGLVYFNMGELTGRDSAGERTANFSAYDAEGVVSYARSAGALSLGAGLKIIREKIESESADAAAIDAGAVYRGAADKFSFSLAARNLGGRVKFIGESFPLPLSASAAVGWKLFDEKLSAALEAVKAKHDKYRFHYGLEQAIDNILFLRAGYRPNSDYGKDYSFGLGLSPGNWRLDYAYLPGEYFEDIHQFTFSVFFGRSPGEKADGIKRREFEEERALLEREKKKFEAEGAPGRAEKAAMVGEEQILAEQSASEPELFDGVTIERRAKDGAGAIHPEMKIIVSEEALKFSSGSSGITSEYFPVLDKIAGLIESPRNQRIKISGYFGREKDTPDNETQARLRTETVRDYFVLKYGLSETNFICEGHVISVSTAPAVESGISAPRLEIISSGEAPQSAAD